MNLNSNLKQKIAGAKKRLKNEKNENKKITPERTQMARSRRSPAFGGLGELGPYTGSYIGPAVHASNASHASRALYTPAHEEAHLLCMLACPSYAKCDDALGPDLFGVDARHVARVGQPEELDRELRAYDALRSIARPGLRALEASLVSPTPPRFDAPHLLVERYTPRGKYTGEVTARSVWALAALLDRMHRSGVAHGCINDSSVGVVLDRGARLVFGSPRCLVVSPFSAFSGLGGTKEVPLEPPLDALRDDPRGLRVHIKHEGEPSVEARAAIAGHAIFVAATEKDREQMIDMFFDVLNAPREADARVWASLSAEAGTVFIGHANDRASARYAKEAERVTRELDNAGALVRAALSQSRQSGLVRALVVEVGEIRAALRSPREVPSGLMPRVRSVAETAKTVLAGVAGDECVVTAGSRGAAKILVSEIARMLAEDDADRWEARLSGLVRESSSVCELVALYSEISEWSRAAAPHEIEASKAILTDHFDDGVSVGDAFTVFANRTSAYSHAERSMVLDACAEALDALDALSPSILRPFRAGSWARINVFVSRQISDTGGPGCDFSRTCGLAHRPTRTMDGPCPHHRYKMGSIQVRSKAENDEGVADTVLHELIHALHFRNEYDRKGSGAFSRAMAGLRALLVEYRASEGERTFSDTYASTNIYEFIVGVAQVLAQKCEHLSRLRAFVAQTPEAKAHALVVLNASPFFGTGP